MSDVGGDAERATMIGHYQKSYMKAYMAGDIMPKHTQTYCTSHTYTTGRTVRLNEDLG